MAYTAKMIKVDCNGATHEFPNKTSANEVIKKVYGKKSGVVAALVNNEQKGSLNICLARESSA